MRRFYENLRIKNVASFAFRDSLWCYCSDPGLFFLDSSGSNAVSVFLSAISIYFSIVRNEN